MGTYWIRKVSGDAGVVSAVDRLNLIDSLQSDRGTESWQSMERCSFEKRLVLDASYL